jgi:hypothetical protein
MPPDATQAEPPYAPAQPSQARLFRPSALAFAGMAMAGYLLLCLPALALGHFNPGVFVHAGDRFVNRAQTEAKLPVKQDSGGYDGQFYYRMAVHPFSMAPTAGGITFDHPPKRMERFLYPLLAWAISAGQPAGAAWALFGLNLCGLGAIAFLAHGLARRLNLPGTMPVAIMLWPGFIVALMYDTAEIVSAAFLLGAISVYLGSRLLAYAVLAACATFTRETTLPVFAGILAYEALAGRTGAGRWPNWFRIGVCAGALVPFVAWREILTVLAHAAPQAQGMAQDLGWPFLGAVKMLWGCIFGARHYASTPFKDMVIRIMVLLTAPAVLLFCGLVLLRLKAAFGQARMAPLAAGWLLTAALMSLLTASGPWIDPVAYFRAFTDCFLVGCLVLFATGFAPRLRSVALLGGAQLMIVWVLCLVKLR